MRRRALDSGTALTVTLLLSVGSTFVVSRILRAPGEPSWERLLVALIPVPLTALFILVEVRALQRADEFVKRLLLESLAIAFPLTILGGITIEQLQRAGFATAVDVGDAWPFMGVVWVICLGVLVWTYR